MGAARHDASAAITCRRFSRSGWTGATITPSLSPTKARVLLKVDGGNKIQLTQAEARELITALGDLVRLIGVEL